MEIREKENIIREGDLIAFSLDSIVEENEKKEIESYVISQNAKITKVIKNYVFIETKDNKELILVIEPHDALKQIQHLINSLKNLQQQHLSKTRLYRELLQHTAKGKTYEQFMEKLREENRKIPEKIQDSKNNPRDVSFSTDGTTTFTVANEQAEQHQKIVSALKEKIEQLNRDDKYTEAFELDKLLKKATGKDTKNL